MLPLRSQTIISRYLSQPWGTKITPAGADRAELPKVSHAPVLLDHPIYCIPKEQALPVSASKLVGTPPPQKWQEAAHVFAAGLLQASVWHSIPHRKELV